MKICNPDNTEFIMDIEKIKIPLSFKKHQPKAYKVLSYVHNIIKNKRFDTAVEVNNNYVLTDGYIRYLICKEFGITNVPCKWKKNYNRKG